MELKEAKDICKSKVRVMQRELNACNVEDFKLIKNIVMQKEKEAIDTVLKALEEKDKEIKRLKQYEDLEWQEFNELAQKENELSNLKEIETSHQKQIGKLEVEMTEKDKMIDLMAKQIVRDVEYYYCELDNMTEDQVKGYFRNKIKQEEK